MAAGSLAVFLWLRNRPMIEAIGRMEKQLDAILDDRRAERQRRQWADLYCYSMQRKLI